jgi:hypothetical protein
MLYLRIALIALCLPAPLAAEERSARFLTLMSHLPEGAIANGTASMAEFVDFAVARDVMGVLAAGGVDPDGQRSIGGPLSEAPQGQDWRGRVGFARGEMVAGLVAGEAEDRGLVLMLSPDVMAAVGPALLADGYLVREGEALPVYWRGEADLAVDRAYRNPDDPFAFPLPRSSRIALEGDLLFQSSSWPGLEAMLAAPEPGAVLKTFGTVLAAPDWGARQLVQAVVFSDPMRFAPPFRLGEGLTPQDAPPGGVPYWSNLMLADLSDGASDQSLIVIVYAAHSDAEAAAAAMQDGLAGLVLPTFGDKTLGDLIGPGRSMVLGNGPYAAVYVVETVPDVRTPRMVRNRGFHMLLNAAVSGDLSLLGAKLP